MNLRKGCVICIIFTTSIITLLLIRVDSYSDYDKKRLMKRLVKNIEIYPEKKAFGYLKSIEFAFPVFKSRLTDEQSTIYTIQDEYPGIIDDEGEFTDYDPADEYEAIEPEMDSNGCVAAYPDELDYFEEHGCLPPDYLRTKYSLEADRYLEEEREKFPPKETTVESVALLIRKGDR